MTTLSSRIRQASLIQQLKRRLLVVVGLLVFVLIFCFPVGILNASLQRTLDEHHISLQQGQSDLLLFVLNQASNVKKYITTNDSTFLHASASARQQYLLLLHEVKNQVQGSNFPETTVALERVEAQVNVWYRTYAQVQIQHMQAGQLDAARFASAGTASSFLFDRVRISVASLQKALEQDFDTQQVRLDWGVRSSLVLALLLSTVAMLVLWHTFTRLIKALTAQLAILKVASNQLGSGDLTARVQELRYKELNDVGQTFNSMVSDLAVRSRDVERTTSELQGQHNELTAVNAALEETNHALSHAFDMVRQLATIVESSSEAIFSKTLEGVIISWNRSAETLFGYLAEEIIGQSVSLLIPPDNQQELGDILARIRVGQQLIKNYETTRIRKDGTPVIVSATISPLLDHQGDIIGSSTIAHDITEQKRVAEELERAHIATSLASIVEFSSDAILSKTLEGVITSWNSSAERLYGYAADEVLGTSLSLIFPPDRQEELPIILERIRLGQQPIKNYETIRVRKDGTLIEVSVTVSPIRDVDGRIVGASTIARDIAEQKRMERELARRSDEREHIMHKLEAMNQQLFDLFEHAPAGLVLFDAHPPYQVLLHNTIFQEFFPEPFHSEGMLGKNLPEYVTTAEEEGISQVFREVVSTRQSKTLFNFVYDGMPRGRTWWNWHLAPIIEDGEVTALTQMVIETTNEVLARQQQETELAERKRAEVALRQSYDNLAALNAALKEASLVRDQFLATMSHELRTPLTSIVGFSEMLLEDAQAADWSQPQQNNLERILTNSEHLLGLINDVLDLSKMEAGHMVLEFSQVDPRKLLSDVAEEIGSLAIKRNLYLKTAVEEGLNSLETNPVKLHQILQNLVSNALKFTEQGGVTVSASRVVLPDKGTEGMAFTVKDSGIGIPPNLQEHIFESFYQVDMSYTRRVGGTGLGLSIARQLTTLLGGTITVDSAQGLGSTFTLTLPVKAVHQPMRLVHRNRNPWVV